MWIHAFLAVKTKACNYPTLVCSPYETGSPKVNWLQVTGILLIITSEKEPQCWRFGTGLFVGCGSKRRYPSFVQWVRTSIRLIQFATVVELFCQTHNNSFEERKEHSGSRACLGPARALLEAVPHAIGRLTHSQVLVEIAAVPAIAFHLHTQRKVLSQGPGGGPPSLLQRQPQHASVSSHHSWLYSALLRGADMMVGVCEWRGAGRVAEEKDFTIEWAAVLRWRAWHQICWVYKDV